MPTNDTNQPLLLQDEKVINSKKEKEITRKSWEKETLLKRWKGNPSSLDLSDLGDSDLNYL